MKSFLTTTVFILAALFSARANAVEAPNRSIFDYFIGANITEVEIHTDMNTLLNAPIGTVEAIQGELRFTSTERGDEVWPITLSTRGKYRLRTCDFPPIKLDFNKKALTTGGFATYDKYKLVTHCDDDKLVGQDQLLREYTVYKMYETLTPNSYRTHLLRIKYVDTTGKVATTRRYAFVMENTKQLADRMAATECESCLSPKPESIDLAAENVHSVFQYLIGNTDFSLPQNRNVKLFQSKNTQQLVPVGYDFDFSALVSATYARPASHLGQQRVSDRLFLGLHVSDAQMARTLALFQSKQADLLATIDGQKLLARTSRDEMMAFVKTFYTQVDTLRDGIGTERSYMPAPRAIPDGGMPEHYGIGK